MHNCYFCEEEVDEDRAEFLIETKRKVTCMDCSTEQKNVGFMVYSHKTAPEMVRCSFDEKETLRIMNRANRRAR